MIDTSLLNANQKDAVLSDDKYLRIIAGAGSGKTRVLTMRICHLIEDADVRAFKILAITFTNKAAKEMKERITNMLENPTSSPWISTIHSLCVRVLREDIQAMGYPRNFTIMDADDQKSVVKEAVKQLELDDEGITPGDYVNYISNCKSQDITPEAAKGLAGSFSDDKAKAKVYEYYSNRQRELYALDFDDLILWTVRMFRKFPEVLAKWQRKFEYVLVDEFQDIDQLQYTLIRQLTGKDSSLLVVGDPDQTIYTWRGADVNIIMDFANDFPDAKTIILNENYRSTEAVLNAANSVIANNRNRMKKDLFTSRKGEEKVTHYAALTEEYQASWVANKIAELHRKGKSYSDIAILYRSNYLSRALEKYLVDERIPYIIYGGIRFYERQEVKDAICYLRMLTTADDLALQRILNRPKRGIGAKTMDNISEEARRQGISMYEVLKQNQIFSGKAKKTIEAFVASVESWRKANESGEVETFRLFERIMNESGYRAMLDEDQEKGPERVENLKALIDDVKEYCEAYPESNIDEYLQEVSLYTDREETMASEFVQLMTVHAAKGLEFDTVFVTDMNDGIFPNERAMNEGNRGVEEERRLAYVAFTRARNKLYLTEAGGFSFILQRVRTTSRFINEIDEEWIEHLGSSQQERTRSMSTGFGGSSYGGRDSFGGSSRQVEVSARLFEETESPQRKMEKAAASSGIKKGNVVTHAKFGEGIVLKITGGIAEIAFPYPFGVKKIAAGHPSLKKKA